MFTGSFRPTTGTRYLHRDYSFTGSLVETAPKSLRHSCRSELTRQGISLEALPEIEIQADDNFLRLPSLHVAMQTGPSHHPMSRASGVWPLRILISSCLGFFRFIVWTISAISMRPSVDLCRPREISSTQRANFSKFCCFGLRNEYLLKNGMIVSRRSARRRTT